MTTMKRIAILALVLAPCPAHADISDSGNLVIGGTATIQGSAFSVGATTFTVAAGTATIGGLLQLSAQGVKFADATVQTTAATSSTQKSSSSIAVSFQALTSVQTIMSKCVPGSTVTVTVPVGGADVRLDFYGSLSGNDGTIYTVGYLRDGAIGQTQTTTKGMDDGGGALFYYVNYKFFDVIQNETAGQHYYCLTVFSDGASTTVNIPRNSRSQARFAATLMRPSS
jgi:hypothetical protein